MTKIYGYIRVSSREQNEDRQRIRELMEKNAALEVDKIKLESRRCDVKGCTNRQPPSDY